MKKMMMAFLLTAALALAVDISGKWTFTVETDAGSGTPTFTFKQDGEKLTGTYRGLLGEANLTGTVKGNQVEFSFDVEGAGTVKYAGTIESGDLIKGTVVLGTVGKGTFTGKKN